MYNQIHSEVPELMSSRDNNHNQIFSSITKGRDYNHNLVVSEHWKVEDSPVKQEVEIEDINQKVRHHSAQELKALNLSSSRVNRTAVQQPQAVVMACISRENDTTKKSGVALSRDVNMSDHNSVLRHGVEHQHIVSNGAKNRRRTYNGIPSQSLTIKQEDFTFGQQNTRPGKNLFLFGW